MTNKRFFVVALLLALVTVLAAPTFAQTGITLTIWADENRAQAMRDIGAEFTAAEGITINVVELPFGEIRDQLKTTGPAGEGPDIILGAHDWVGELVASGLLQPLNLGGLEEDFAPVSIQAFTWDGQLYGLPYAVENVALFRNTDLVPDAPATWEEVAQITRDLVDSGDAQYGWVIQENDPYHFFPLQTAFGGYVFGLDEQGNYDPSDVGIDSEGSIEALAFLEALVDEGYVPGGIDGDTMNSLFRSGDAAMIITGPWSIPDIEAAGVPYAISNIPGVEEGTSGRPFVGVQGFMVSAFSENADIAELFLTEFLATTEAQLTLYEVGGRPPAYLPALELVENEDFLAIGQAGAEGLAMPSIPEMGAVWTSWGNAVALTIQGQLSAEEAFASAADQIRTAIGQTEASS